MITFADAQRIVEVDAPGTVTAPYGYESDERWFPIVLPERIGGRVPGVSKADGALTWVSSLSPEYSESRPCPLRSPEAALHGLPRAAHAEPDPGVAAALVTLRGLRTRLSGVRLRELDEIIVELMASTFEPAKAQALLAEFDESKHKRDGKGRFTRTGALGSVLEKLESLREKLNDDDRAELDRAMDQLRGLESSDVDDDDLIEDEEDADEESSDLVMDSAFGELTFTPYTDGEIDVDWDDGSIRFTPQSAREVADAVAQFNALPVVKAPETPKQPDSVTTQDQYRQWYRQWRESDVWADYNAISGEMTTSDGELMVRRWGSGVVEVGDPGSVDGDESSGVLSLDDTREGAVFVDFLRIAMSQAGQVQASTPVRFFTHDPGGPLFVRARATRQRLAAKYDPLQKRDGDGKWTDGSGPIDRLKLADRIELEQGESFVASDVFKVGDGSIMPMALTRTPNGPRLRMGVQIDADDQKKWSGRDLGATVSLDQVGMAKLRSAVDEMHTKGDEGGRRFAAIEDRADDLDQQRRDILKRQYASLSKADGKRLDRLDRQIEKLDQDIENTQQGLRDTADYLSRNDPDARARWDEISAEVATLDPEDDADEIARLQVEQARLAPSYPLTRLRAIPRMQEEREDLELERQELTADASPLSVQDQSDLATVDAAIASNEAERQQMSETELVEGVIQSEWSDLMYEVSTNEMTREYENLGIGYRMAARPKDAPADWVPSDTDSWVEFEPGDLLKLGRTLDGLLPPVENAVGLLPSSVTSARVTAKFDPSQQRDSNGRWTDGRMDGLDVMDAEQYAAEFGETADEKGVADTALTVRVFDSGESHLVLDLPGDKFQVLSEQLGSEHEIRLMAYAVSDAQSIDVDDAHDDDFHEVLAEHSAGGVTIGRYGSGEYRLGFDGTDDYMDLSEQEADGLWSAFDDMADLWEEQFGGSDGVPVVVSDRAVTLPRNHPGKPPHTQTDHGRKKKLPDLVPAAPAVTEPAKKPARKKAVPKAPAAKPGKDEPQKLTKAKAAAMQRSMTKGQPWTSGEKESLKAWTTSGFHDIRLMIQNPGHEPFLGIGGRAEVKQHIRNIHSAMRPLPKPVKVFRKVDPEGVGLKRGDDPKSLVGKRMQNPNFTATSVEPDAGFLGASRPIHIEIDAPSGTPAAYLESLTETKGEGELLFDAGLPLEFLDATTRPDGVVVLKARVAT